MSLKKLFITGLITFGLFISVGCSATTVEATPQPEQEKTTLEYYFPHENDAHEGTWLQWPNDNLYEYTIEDYEPIWIEMTRGLIKGENVHIIVYNDTEKERVQNVLIKENIDLTNIDFFVFQYDDVWVRDNGPIFAYDKDDNLIIQDWAYNGWGNKAPYKKNDLIPSLISEAIDVPKIDIDMIMEGGALELDGQGTCISTLSCVNNDNRTPNFTLEEIESYLSKYYGVTNFIWLNGVAGMDITDGHIDGMIKLVDENTILAAPSFDPDSIEFNEEDPDVEILHNAKNAKGQAYELVFLPSTKKNVVKVQGEWITGAYLNFYVGNAVVLVPNYKDENDAVANEIIQELYPDREVIGIDVRNLYVDGGMIHCVTQQQPIDKIQSDIE